MRSSRVAGAASQMKSDEDPFASSLALSMSAAPASAGASTTAPRFSAWIVIRVSTFPYGIQISGKHQVAYELVL